MLSIGPGSACDVCLEPFGPDVKAPCSIQCGHVFCVTCLHQMVQLSCPLCRNHFDQRTVVKLHVDMDTVVSTCPTSAQQEARRLQEAIANVANEGTTEARLRQLIADATEFLATQPRDMFSDLRVTHRMIAYLCEVKSRQRIQRGELDEHKLQITQLNKEKEELAHEKEELLRSIEVAASIRRDEKETALAVELSLRDHCARAHAAYGTMVETYNYLVGEWMKLQEEVKRLREAEGLHVSDLRIPMADTRRSPIIEPTLYAPSSSGSDYEMKLSKAAISEPDSFFVSPLPEFSNKGLATVSMDLFSLPDVVYEVDNKPNRASSSKDTICDSKYHPTACRCVQVPPAHEAPHSVMVASTPNSSRSRGSSVVDRPSASDSSIDRSPIYAAPLVHSSSSFNDDNPRYRPQRTTSRSSRPSSLSRPPSRPPTRPSSPSRRSVSSQQGQNRIPSPMDAATSPRANMTLPQSGQNKVNNPRLHDLLQDSNSATVSSSLPNMTSHFPPIISRDSYSSRSRDHVDSPTRSRSRSVSGHRSSLPSPPQVREAHPATAIPDPPPQTTTPPSSSYMNPGTVVSTASNAASLLEKAKKERRREEEERQREREKEQSRREREKARDKLERERDRGGRERDKAERERDIERDREKVEKEQRREEKRTRERQTSSASSSYPAASTHREQFPTNLYAGATPVSVSYGSQRVSTTSSSSRSGSGALRDSYNVHKHTTNALPVLGTTRV